MHAIHAPEVRLKPARHRSPIVVLLEGLRWASGLHWTVVPSVAGHGVKCVTRRAGKRWVRACRFGEVSPQGALLLIAQPQSEAVDEALCQVMGCSLALIEGLQLGLDGMEQPEHWVGRQDEDELGKGYDGGRNIRISLLSLRPPRSRTPAPSQVGA